METRKNAKAECSYNIKSMRLDRQYPKSLQNFRSFYFARVGTYHEHEDVKEAQMMESRVRKKLGNG